MTAATCDRRLVAEPIMAWKRARLADLPDGTIGFEPVSASGTYRTVEVAECRPVPFVTPGLRGRGLGDAVSVHDAPDPACACGFYATKDRRDPPHGQVTLRVALTGTVVVHTRGYRAQRQQVVAVEIPERCACGRKDIAGLVPIAPYQAVCHGCVPNGHIIRLWSRSDLANSLGVDVAWCPPYASNGLHIGGVVSGGQTYVSFGVSAAAFQQAMQTAIDKLDGAAQALQRAQPPTLCRSGARADHVFVDELTGAVSVDPAGRPEHPLDAKRRRDEERRQRLEQLSGPRRAPTHIRARKARQ